MWQDSPCIKTLTARRLKTLFHDAMEVKPGLPCQGQLQTESGTSPRERCILWAAKPEKWGHLCLLTSDINYRFGFFFCWVHDFFVSVFPHHAQISSFWELYNFCFDFSRGYT